MANFNRNQEKRCLGGRRPREADTFSITIRNRRSQELAAGRIPSICGFTVDRLSLIEFLRKADFIVNTTVW
jgi:hypothetical protein